MKEKDQKPVTRPVEANTDLLARLESFLPEIQKANEDIRCSEKQSTCNEYVLELPEYDCFHFFAVGSYILEDPQSHGCSAA